MFFGPYKYYLPSPVEEFGRVLLSPAEKSAYRNLSLSTPDRSLSSVFRDIFSQDSLLVSARTNGSAFVPSEIGLVNETLFSPLEGDMNARVAVFSALGVGGVLFTLWAGLLSGRHYGGSAALRAEIAAAVGGLPPDEGRPTGGFLRTGRARKDTGSNAKLKELQNQVEDALAKRRSPQTLADAALLKRFAGKQDEAITLLQEAVALDPQKATFLNDLAATFLARSLSRGPDEELPDVARALSCADRSLEIAPDLVEAHFNRAIALERLYLLPEAQLAWHQYLDYDSRSVWAQEAQSRLSRLERKNESELWEEARSVLRKAAVAGDTPRVEAIVQRFPRPSRTYAERELLGSWALARKQGRIREAEVPLAIARAIGQALVRHSDEHIIEDGVSAIDDAIAIRRSAETIMRLEEGHLAYQVGLALYEEKGPETAAPHFLRAERSFQEGRSAFRLLASFQHAVCLYRRGDYASSREAFTKLTRSDWEKSYPVLAAHSYWMIGLCAYRRAEPLAALSAYRRSLTLLHRTGEREAIAAIHQYLSETYRYLGDSRQAWSHRRIALDGLSTMIDASRRYNLLNEMGNALMEIDEPRSALYFRDAVVRLTRGQDDPEGRAFTLLRRAETHHELRHRQQAIADLSEAGELASAIKEQDVQAGLLARIGIIEGRVLADIDAQASLQSLNAALAHCRLSKNDFLLIGLYWTRSQVFRRIGQSDAAIADLQAAAQEYERQRNLVLDYNLRLTYFRQAREIFEELIRLEVEVGDKLAALTYAERLRSRLLLDQVTSERTSRPLAAGEISSRMAEGVVLLEYFLLEDYSVILASRRKELDMFVVNSGRAEIHRLVQELRNKLGVRVEVSAELSALYEELLSPVEDIIKAGDLIVLVPDGSLHAVPFAALLNPKLNRHLIEDNPIVVAPSATLYFASVDRERELSSVGEQRALILGDPTLDRTVLPDEVDLEGARSEAEAISNLYNPARVSTFIGPQATEERFLLEAGQHDIIQVSSHSFAAVDPFFSYLALAPGKKRDGILYAAELERFRFNRPRLLVLSSCKSGDSSVDAAEGLMSLGRSVLMAGIPAVAVSLWDVDDNITGSLLVDFHQEILLGNNPAVALQKAQVAYVRKLGRDSRQVQDWGGFQIVGGVDHE